MKIETKYNIGDEIWAIVNTEAKKVSVISLQIKTNSTNQNLEINYGVILFTKLTTVISEEKLFPTKEELIASL